MSTPVIKNVPVHACGVLFPDTCEEGEGGWLGRYWTVTHPAQKLVFTKGIWLAFWYGTGL